MTTTEPVTQPTAQHVVTPVDVVDDGLVCPCRLPPRDTVPTRAHIDHCLECWDEGHAVELQRRRVAADPQSTQDVVRLVQLARASGNISELREFLAGLGHLTPVRSLGQGLLSYESFLKTGEDADFVSAQAEIRAALAVKPDDPYALASAIVLYLARGQQVPSYLELVRKLCDQEAGKAAVVLAACARVSFAVGDPVGGNTRFRQSLEKQPDLYAAWLLWGRHALEAGRLGEAVRNFEQASKSRQPGLKYGAYLGLGSSRFLQGDFAAADRAFRAAAHAYTRAKPVLPHAVPAALQYNLGLALALQPDEKTQREALQWLGAYLDNADADPQRLLRARQTIEIIRRRWRADPAK